MQADRTVTDDRVDIEEAKKAVIDTPDAPRGQQSAVDDANRRPGTPGSRPAASGTKMGPAAAEGDTEKQVTSPIGQDDTQPSDKQSPPAQADRPA